MGGSGSTIAHLESQDSLHRQAGSQCTWQQYLHAALVGSFEQSKALVPVPPFEQSGNQVASAFWEGMVSPRTYPASTPARIETIIAFIDYQITHTHTHM